MFFFNIVALASLILQKLMNCLTITEITLFVVFKFRILRKCILSLCLNQGFDQIRQPVDYTRPSNSYNFL